MPYFCLHSQIALKTGAESMKRVFTLIILLLVLSAATVTAQIPLDRVLSRGAVPPEGGLRGLVDVVGFPQTAEQMDYIGTRCDELEAEAFSANRKKYGFSEDEAFVFAISPHDDYALAGRVYTHVHRHIKAKTVILIGNAHWSEAFGIRDKIVFGDFTQWRGPYGPVTVSDLRGEIQSRLPEASFLVNRKLAETEHGLEGMIPFLQYYNRDVEIVPVFIPFAEWETLDRLAGELAAAVSGIMKERGLQPGSDIAILCSTDGMHYGDYGWSYYDYHPFGCDIDGYARAVALDRTLVSDYLTGTLTTRHIRRLFTRLVDRRDISNYTVTWCGRFAAPFAADFAVKLMHEYDGSELAGMFLRHGTSLSDPWLDVGQFGLGVTADANLHHFVTYFAVGYTTKR